MSTELFEDFFFALYLCNASRAICKAAEAIYHWMARIETSFMNGLWEVDANKLNGDVISKLQQP